MTGHTSHNDPPRAARRRRTLLSLAALAVVVTSFPITGMGRTIDTHPSRLADLRPWMG